MFVLYKTITHPFVAQGVAYKGYPAFERVGCTHDKAEAVAHAKADKGNAYTELKKVLA